ncbi:MAG: hypothetical protein P8Y45_04990 [Exilibacterium sp.]
MLIENIELTMSHLGLGNLSEYALMVLFGNAHSHHLVAGTGLAPDLLRDKNANALYPAYFMTRLSVPETVLLHSFKLWERVSVGVDVKRFGDTLLESRYILGREGEVAQDAQTWERQNLPTMEGNNLIVIENIDAVNVRRKVANPDPDCIAKLPKARVSPRGVTRSKIVRSRGFETHGVESQRVESQSFESKPPDAAARLEFANKKPFHYEVLPGRDAAPGHAMIFARFCEIMDAAEYQYFSREFTPALPDELITCFSVLDREVFYYGNCYAGETLSIHLRGSLQIFEEGELLDNCNYVRAAMLNLDFELFQHRNKSLLAMARTRKMVAIPMHKQDVISDLQRLVYFSSHS